MELAHPVVAGSFGPAGRHIVMLYRPDGEDIEFQGTVYLEGKRAGLRYRCHRVGNCLRGDPRRR